MSPSGRRWSSRVPLRVRLWVYLGLVHLTLALLAVPLVVQRPVWLFAVEGLLVLSLALGVLLVRALLAPFALIRTSTGLIAERDFGSTFREVGHPEADALIGVCNRMIETLRRERLRLEEQGDFLAKLLEASPAGVVTLDHDERVAEVNPRAAELLGFDPREATGRPLAAAPSPAARELAELGEGESRLLADGGPGRLRAERARLWDRGFPRTFYVVEELTAELRASEKAAYETLIRLVSHEVNNSVGAVGSLLQSLATMADGVDETDRADFRSALAVAASRLERLEEFVRGLAEVVRLPAPEPMPCDVDELVDGVVRLFRPELDRRGVRLIRSGGVGARVELDRGQIELVLVNLLRNAAEAIGEGGSIEVETRPAAGRRPAWLAVRDDGPGIAPEHRAALFTPFFSSKRQGRGIGLTLSSEVLSAHHFGFRLGDRPDGGQGAEFRIELPRRR